MIPPRHLTLRKLVYLGFHALFWPMLRTRPYGRRMEQHLKLLALDRVSQAGNGYRVSIDGVTFQLSELDHANVLLREPVAIDRFREVVPGAEVVADVGSKYGFYGLISAFSGCDEAFLFEMSEDVLPGLMDNIRLNGVEDQCTAINKAVWCKETRVPIEPDPHFADQAIGAGDTYMDAVSLDTFFADRQNPDVVKIDVEGAEIKVLEGMTRILKESRPILFIEIHDADTSTQHASRHFNSSVDAVTSFLQDYGYGWELLDQTSSHVTNILAAPTP